MMDNNELRPGPEQSRPQDFFLTRVVGVQGIVAMLKSHGNLNSTGFNGDTHFAFGANRMSDEDIVKSGGGYASGGGTIGTFVIFPEESRQLGVMSFRQGSVTGAEVVIPPDRQITEALYLFVLPFELPRIKNAVSRAEALEILGEDREPSRQYAIERAGYLISLRSKLSQLLNEVPYRAIKEQINRIYERNKAGENVKTLLETGMSIDGYHGGRGIEETEKIIAELLPLKP